MKRIVMMVLLGVAPFVAAGAAAQQAAAGPGAGGDATDLAKLRSEARHDKHALVASTLALNDDEAKRFWPIYETFQRTLTETNRRRNVALESLMFRENRMTNLAAKRLVTEMAVIDDTEAKARRTLRNRVMRALPPVKAARYLQLEDKLQAIRDYDIATAVPLVH
jgi:hypothetical protein